MLFSKSLILILSIVCLVSSYIAVVHSEKYKYIHVADYQGSNCIGDVLAGSFSLNDACPNQYTHQKCTEDGLHIEMTYYSGQYCTGDVTGKDLVPTGDCTYSEFMTTCTQEAIYPRLNNIIFYYTNGTCLDLNNPKWITSIVDIDYTLIDGCFPGSNAFSYQCNSTTLVKSIFQESNSCDTLLGTEVVPSSECSAESPYFLACNQQMNP